MKKNLLLAAAMMFSASCFAQTTLWDGENFELGSQGGCWDDGSPVVVENPDQGGINTSERCLKFTMTNDRKVVKIPFRDWVTPAMDGSRRISMMVRKAQDENLMIEVSDPTDGSNGYWEKVAVWYGGSGEWQKVVFDFSANPDFDHPGVISITAQTGGVEGEQDVYIDNVTIEPATRANGQLIKDIEDGTLTGNITLTGAWMKGDCQNADNDWVANVYNDFALLAKKMNAGTVAVDMRGTVLKDAYNAFGGVNPNILIYTDGGVDGDNVVVCTGEGNRAGRVVLDERHAFGALTGFDAAEIVMNRPLYEGYNTIYLPFFVSKADLGATALATFSGINGGEQTVVSFNEAEYAEANTPLLVSMADGRETLTFTGKYVTELSDGQSQTAFCGIYAPRSGAGLWGVADNNTFMKGGDEATINAFHAYLEAPAEAKSVTFGTTTGISSICSDARTAGSEVYTLSGMRLAGGINALDKTAKGIYIVNGKKVFVK